ncbi:MULTISPECIES: hypothetical protein [unclassified Microbulbifer]|uniref:hypothetical protein n=1 Tax=unclassified Microbulbifer TaxID=2619833 RepID=UPI0027E4DE39|nr:MULTISPECIES: hypothetical protein [unclassified Microbulbifer]
MTAALTTYATEKRDRYQALKVEAQAAFATANEAFEIASEEYQDLVNQSAALERDIAGLRKQLSGSSHMPADITELSEELRSLLIERSHLTAALSITGEDRNSAKVAAELHRTRLTELDSALKQAESELASAQAMEDRHDAWTDAGLESEIATVRDHAAALLADTFTPDPGDEINPAEILAAARARVEEDIPEVLRDRARARAAQAVARQTAHNDLRDAVVASALAQGAAAGGSGGLVVQRQMEFKAAEADLKSYALNSLDDYQRAIELLQSVVNSEELTDAAAESIDDAALAAGDPAITTEEALHDARAAVEAKEVELELATVNALIGDINADPEDDTDVQARRSELESLEGDLEAAETAHTEELATAMDIWEAAVPPAIWNNLRAFDRALELLTELSSSDASPLIIALTDTESALIDALALDDDNRRLAGYLKFSTALTQAESDYLARTGSSMTSSAMRGDF